MCFLRMREPGDAMKVPVLRKDEILLMRSSIKMSPGADVIWYTKENVQSEQYFFIVRSTKRRKLRTFGAREQPKSGFLRQTEREDGRLLSDQRRRKR